MTKQNLFFAALLIFAAPLAQAREIQIAKAHEPISFNAMISQNDADAEALHAQFSRRPDSVDESQDDANVEAAPSAPDTASNDN